MTELFSLIKSLHDDEIKAIQSSFKKTGKGESEQLLLSKLFNSIISGNGKTKTNAELSVLLYQQHKPGAAAKAKSRLFNWILSVLSSDHLLQKEHLFDPADKHIIRVRNKMLQFRVIYRKKNRADIGVLFHVLNEVIKEAREYEQYDILVEALSFKKYLLMLRKGVAQIKEIEKEIVDYSFAHQAILKTNEHYFNLVTNQDVIRRIKPQRMREMTKSAILELNDFIKRTDSALIKYMTKLLELDYLISTGQHIATIDVCNEVITHLNSHPTLYRKERMGFIYDNISLCEIYKQDFQAAIASTQKAQQYYSKNGINYMFSKQQEFYAAFYAGNYKAALEIIKNLLTFPLMNTGEYRYDKYLFLKACTLFQLKAYRDALAICNQTLSITKDKGRWDIGIRYLRFMCLIELAETDTAHPSIEALRKMVGRSKFISARDQLIYKTLNEFSYTGFDPVPSVKLAKYLNRLSLKDGSYAWNYYTHELIPIQIWMNSYLKKKRRKKKVA